MRKEEKELTIEQKLKVLYELQRVNSKIDELRTLAGELPQEVKDMSDEVEGLKTRLTNIENDIKDLETKISDRRVQIENDNASISRYKEQQDNVRNNREYESLAKEIEFQNLEIQLCERKNKEGAAKVKELKEHIATAKTLLENRNADLESKREELTSIIAETEKDEKRLHEKSKEQEQYIDERYLTAYKRIRGAARNGLAVVQIDRDSCGGCFSNIPPQRQMEIKMHKKVIVCENCGRILVDDDIAAKAKANLEK